MTSQASNGFSDVTPTSTSQPDLNLHYLRNLSPSHTPPTAVPLPTSAYDPSTMPANRYMYMPTVDAGTPDSHNGLIQGAYLKTIQNEDGIPQMDDFQAPVHDGAGAMADFQNGAEDEDVDVITMRLEQER